MYYVPDLTSGSSDGASSQKEPRHSFSLGNAAVASKEERHRHFHCTFLLDVEARWWWRRTGIGLGPRGLPVSRLWGYLGCAARRFCRIAALRCGYLLGGNGGAVEEIAIQMDKTQNHKTRPNRAESTQVKSGVTRRWAPRC